MLITRTEAVQSRNGRPPQAYICIPVTCRCPGRRRPPLRLIPEALFWLREALGGRMPPPSLVVQTWRCADCGHVVEITAGDLQLSGLAE